MKLLLNFLISFVVALPLNGLTWSPTPPGEIDNFAINNTALVTCAPTPNPGEFISVYLNQASTSAYYSLYNESTGIWSSSAQLTSITPNTLSLAVYCTYGNSVNFLTACDPTNKVVFSTYNGSTFSTSAPIAGGGNVAIPVVSSVYNTFSKTFLTVWLDVGTGPIPVPYFSSTNDNGATWVPAAAKAIPWSVPPDLNDVEPPLFNAASTLDDNFMIVWSYTLNSSLNDQNYYYFYFGNTTTQIDAGLISLGLPNVAPSVAFDPNKNQYILTYFDINTGYPYYAIYDVSTKTWSAPLQIPGTFAGYAAVTSTLNSNTNTLLFTWVDAKNSPYYVTYNSSSAGSPWGTPAIIPGGSSTPQGTGIVYPTFDPTTSQFLVTWADEPYYTSPDTNPIYVTASSGLTTTTKVTTSPSHSKLFQNVTLQATVTGAGSPTGTVTFYINGTKVGTAPVDPLTGIATLTAFFTTKGTSTVEAVYSGDDTFSGSAGTSTQKVSCCNSIKLFNTKK